MVKHIMFILLITSLASSIRAGENGSVVFSDGLTKVSDTKLQGDYSLSGFFVSSSASNNCGTLDGMASAKTLTTSTKSTLTLPENDSIQNFQFWMRAVDNNPPTLQVKIQIDGGAWNTLTEITETSLAYVQKNILVNIGSKNVRIQLYIEKTNTQGGYYFDDFTLTKCSGCTYQYAALAPIFTNGMVLQRNQPINIWGTASNNLEVTLELQGETYTVNAGNGNISFSTKPLTAGGPCQMFLKWDGGQKIYDDIYIGDVFLAGGQSNMDFAIRKVTNADAEMAKADYPLIRYYSVPKDYYEGHNKPSGSWEPCTPDKISEVFAVPFYFAREIYESENIPVGIVQCALGGTSAESWMSREVLMSDKRFSKELIDYDNIVNQYKTGEYEELLAKYNAGEVSTEPMGYKNFRRPSGMYYTMFKKIVPFTIKSVLFYQGETNAKRGYNYRYLFPALIDLWRNDLNQPDVPFLFVQLPRFGASINWADIRESQLIVSQTVPNTAITVAFDQGNPNNIHPTQKDTVGIRLAKLALGKLYEKSGNSFFCPTFREMNVRGNEVVLYFDNIGDGLIPKGTEQLKGFTICGNDNIFVNANAIIDGDSVIVSNPTIANPKAVRYGWFASGEINLFTKGDLPASPFRTDDFKLSTQEEDDWSGIESNILPSDNLKVSTEGNNIKIDGTGRLFIFNLEGKVLHTCLINNEYYYQCPEKGLLFVVLETSNRITTKKIINK